MCGIAGIVGTFERSDAERGVRKMISALARRGPDSEGIESWDKAVLGHRRLAIFDLSEAGRQPMLTKDRSVGVVFNGAIYNYRELRKELSASGYSFESNTDTEVLIHGYREWGIAKLISRLRGMFAFGLWDNSRNRLYLVRDRLGVKPLVFCQRNGTVAFASTVRALRTAGYAGDVDEAALLDFMKFGFVTDDHAIYRGVVKVPPGTIVEWSRGFLKKETYWQFPITDDSSKLSFDDAVEETERLLLQAVELRLNADVPVGALLSGGIDSSLICWAVAKLGGNITAYTVGTPGDVWDETAAASDTARILGIQHRVLTMDDKVPLEINELVSAYAEPFGCASALGMLALSRAMASSVKVMLTGDGGDDVFLGYPPHRHLWLAQNLARILPSAGKSSWLALRSIFPRVGPLRRAAALFDYTAGGLNALVGYSDDLARYQMQGLLGDRLLSMADSDERSWSANGTHHVLEEYLTYERKHWFLSEYMTKVDGATMYFGLEARSPFLDHCLWQFASSLPFTVRLYHWRLKAILRELARRRISWAVARRRKKGFGIPVRRWIVGRWRSEVETMLRKSVLAEKGWIRSDVALAQLKLAVSRGVAPETLWYIFVLESWLRYEGLSHSA